VKVGIFGGTFNPIHYGHLRAAEEVRERLRMDRILFIPSGSPPLKTKELSKAEHRYEMTRLAILDNPSFELSDMECRRAGKSYTLNTIEELKQAGPDTAFYFILGIDAFLDIPNWWRPDRLVTLTDFIIISRPESRFVDLRVSPYLKISQSALKDLDASVTDICTAEIKKDGKAFLVRLTTPIGSSSTVIRTLVRQGKSVKYLLPPNVQSYIISNGLYKR
jgi:nicotinate-nucleotide adenylyltransferase